MNHDSLTRKKASGKRMRLHKKRLVFLLSLFLLIAVLLWGTRFLGSFQALQNEAEWARSLRDAPQTGGINYLLYGLRQDNGEASIEEIFFLNFPVSEDSFHTIFIPGDILLHRGEEKRTEEPSPEEPLSEDAATESALRSFYTPSHFYNEGGAELLIKQLSFFLGSPVHHYLEINYDGIPALVDYCGGIEYKGFTLKGQDYLDYFLQSENGEDPLVRALRRANHVEELVKLPGDKKGPFNLSRIIREVSPYFNTDLSWKELKAFYERLGPFFDPQGMVVQLPGVWRDINGDTFFEPNLEQLVLVMQNLGQDFILPRELITIEVLNGSGVTGIASTVGELLKEEGFQVVRIDNADSFDYQSSQVISHLENTEPAREIALLIGAEFFKEPMPDHPAMITVIVGKNFSL